MTEKTLLTGRTIYVSDNGGFSSVRKDYVQTFDKTKLDVANMDFPHKAHWMMKGHLRTDLKPDTR